MNSRGVDLIRFLAICCALSGPAVAAERGRCEKPWLFFDLGNTILDTKSHGADGAAGTIRYVPAVHEYLKSLKAKNYHIGLIVNIPQGWGVDRPAKVAYLKKYIGEHWKDTDTMDWALFDLGILVPPSDQERKPAPFLFEEALQMAKKAGCSAIYQGETPREIAVANAVGLRGFEIGRKDRFFLPENEIVEFAVR